MAQVRGGKVFLEDGSSEVFRVHAGSFESEVGTMAIGAAVTWGADGVGLIREYNDVGKSFSIQRTSGAFPVAADTVVEAGNSFVVSVMSNAPQWDVQVPVSGPRKFTAESGVLYDVASVVAPDKLLLSATWSGLTQTYRYGIQHQYTSGGLGLMQRGDASAVDIMSDNMAKLDQSYSPSQLTASTTAITQPGVGLDAVIVFDNVIQNEDNFWNYNNATGEITIGGGVKAVGISFQGEGINSVSSFETIKLMGSTVLGAFNIEATFSGLNGVYQMNFGMVPVAAGDILTIKAFVQKSTNDLKAGTWFNMWRAG